MLHRRKGQDRLESRRAKTGRNVLGKHEIWGIGMKEGPKYVLPYTQEVA